MFHLLNGLQLNELKNKINFKILHYSLKYFNASLIYVGSLRPISAYCQRLIKCEGFLFILSSQLKAVTSEGVKITSIGHEVSVFAV